ncbi:hypothetical protein AB0J27_20310 [Micromonospora chokoriensis]
MTVYAYGGDIASYVVAVGTDDAVIFAPGVTLKAYTAQTGGIRITDLADADGDLIDQVTSSDGTDGYARGSLPRFRAPVKWLWLGEDGAPRVLAVTTDLPDLVDQAINAATAAQLAAEVAASNAAEVAASSSVTGHVAASDPHTQYHNDARGDSRYLRTNPPASAPLTTPREVFDFTSTPASTDADMRQIYVTHSGVRRLVRWDNERGYYRAEQVAGSLYDAPLVSITAYNGTGRALQVQQRGADNVRRDVGGIDKDGRVVTSDQPWQAITVIDPGTTGRYTQDATAGISPLRVRRETNDILRLQGRVAVNASGTSSGHVVMTLPATYRPSTARLISVPTSTGIACPCEVMADGQVILRRTQTGALSLSFDDFTLSA